MLIIKSGGKYGNGAREGIPDGVADGYFVNTIRLSKGGTGCFMASTLMDENTFSNGQVP
jgi:hypothetical protein